MILFLLRMFSNLVKNEPRGAEKNVRSVFSGLLLRILNSVTI